MKKIIKKSKKTIILSVILFAFFCLNAFNSAHFLTETTVSAEETREQTTTYINLTKSGVVNYWSNVSRSASSPSYTYWTDIQVSGDNGVIASRTVNGYSIKNFYSTQTGEEVCIIPTTTISIQSYLSQGDLYNKDNCAIVFAISNRVTLKTTYVVEIFDPQYVEVIEIGSYNIDGVGFPSIESDAFGKYVLLSIQLLTIDEYEIETSAGYYGGIFQPIFNLNTGSYKDYYAIFFNCSVQDYNLSSPDTLKFTDFFAQITDLDNSAVENGTGVPVQNGYNSTITDYKIEYQAKTATANAYIHNASADGSILYIASGSTILQKKVDSSYTNYATSAGFSWTPTTSQAEPYMTISTTEDGDDISLKSSSNALSSILQNFNILLKAITQETPEQETPEQEQEQPKSWVSKYNAASKKHSEENFWWAVGTTLGTGLPGWAVVEMVTMFQSLHDAGGLGKGIAESKEQAAKNTASQIAAVLKTIFTAIGTTIKDFFDIFGALSPNEKTLATILIIAGILGGGFLGYLFIKKKNEN